MIWLLLLPILAALLLLALPKRMAWPLAILAAGACLAESVQLALGPVPQELRYEWIPSIGAQFLLTLDGISLLFVGLTALMSLLGILASPQMPRAFYSMLLLLEAGCFGVFLAQDLLLFFICFEAVLIPMYFLIGIWGAERRQYAAFKFFLYTVAGSIALLVGFLALYLQHAAQTGIYSFDLQQLLRVSLPLPTERLVFWALFLGFAIKIPMLPFHTWLPDAHTQAPTAGSVMLAAVMLKMGTYGFLRFSLPLLPKASLDANVVQVIGALSVAAILYGGLICLAQRDWKRLIAYSSVSHLGFCTLGIFSLNQMGIEGSILQQVNHGISTGLLFLLIGFIYDRRHSRDIGDYGGISKVMPGYAAVFAVAMLSSIGLPLLNGFVGEFTILRGAFLAQPWWAVLAVVGIILSAGYMLSLYRHTMLGPITKEENRSLKDLSFREWLIVSPLLVWAVWIGVYPSEHFRLIQEPVGILLERLRP
ncbi:complex I subunit 4 family protein, partial [Bryobacter aggregatus]|uniref:complex I subunit 4 family protein n=1 Tax=Bryobacter aggregatus TaxID=360054 RepID=UPI0004E2053D